MTNVINIKEEKNRLSLVGTYTPVVAGNSNYYLSFSFSEEWQKCNRKTAIFVVEGKKIAVEFEGVECKVPVLPNAPCFFVALVSADNETEQLATTSLRLRLESTFAHEEMGELNPLKGYLAGVIGAINKIENGDLSVKSAERAFNVSNENMLLNGNFQVNQRGQVSYELEGNNYTFDRWQGFSGLVVSKTDKGIFIDNLKGLSNGCFQQKLENKFSDFAGKLITISAKVNGEMVKATAQIPSSKPSVETHFISKSLGILNAGTSETYLRFTMFANGTLSFNFYIPTCSSFELEWAKLEIGEYPTTFVPRVYAEEFALCQRYYRVYKQIDKTLYCPIGILQAGNTGVAYGLLNLGISMRTPPSLAYSKMEDLQFSAGTQVGSHFKTFGTYTYSNPTNTFVVFLTGTFVAGQMYLLSVINGGKIELDAEIY